ncbi:YtpR family tRNA-binding protein [Liquorilactobacillus mali]|uniref:tRNA-binding domain-containing protein n=1 Tax=Liquorilactobacillus mali KCTC 3596 = DSM 20444 TaxID=1046596 RepID=J0UQM4_9LACO|nr:DUF4479 and tRNA-binding domain-containing protein [Liquorilactobacillus mali]EJE98257.1 tRNA-binding domain-containing protein [Liquorilactobacillus mali KCTC 3596 = DSM 20444]KRN10491.1 tRNA-binding domain-containing protein [Liquorilactobacillus mali KCTC 3596 = DSM 20444]MDV7757072.1 DUF4479 domain-containing protein [Liquorilactobacillus mali]QFQ75090.1 DUF4479 domain-containing protein [Liquorilactobacillus mali]
MLIASYNKAQIGDILIVMLHEDAPSQTVEKKDSIVEISDSSNGTKLGYNFLGVGEKLGLTEAGQVKLSNEQVNLLNGMLQKAGFEAILEIDETPKFVVGLVEEMTEHPDSDHLHITKTNIGSETLQIVCGAPNIAQNQLVVVARVGAMMPNGEVIWPGKLRGVESDGMICSARELHLPNAPKKRGILVLPAGKFHQGQPFSID